MKRLTVSFLFFYCQLVSILFFAVSPVNGQKVTDSTTYYYKMVLSSKSKDSLLSGYVFFRNRKEQNLKDKDEGKAIFSLRMIVIAQIDLGLNREAESSIIEALKLIDNQEALGKPLIKDKLALFNDLGMVYRTTRRYDKAIAIYNKALDIAKEKGAIIPLHNNKGSVYKDLGNHQRAEKEYLIVYRERLKTGNRQMLAKALDNLGSVQWKLGNEKGVERMFEALKIRVEDKDVGYYYTSYKHLTEYYKDIGNLEEAKKYANLAYEAASLYRQPFLKDALPRLLELSEDKLVLEYVKMNDSLTKERLLIDEKYSSAKYNLEKEQFRTFEAQLQKERQKKLKLIYLFSGLFVLLMAVLRIVILRNRHKKEKVKQVYNTERRISKKVHDEVANDMSGLMSFVENNQELPEHQKTILLNALDDLYIRTRDISTQAANIDVINFSESLRYLLMQHNRNGTKMITNDINTISWTKVSDYKKMAVFRCIQELLVNMKKHSEAKVVSIVFKEHGRKKEILYSDDGKGFAIERVQLNGLLNVESRIKGIKGSINFRTSEGHGFKAILKFKG